MQFKKNTLVQAGNHHLSIGRDGHQVAICSNATGDFVELKRTKTNKRLRKIKRKFGLWLTDSDRFFFERMSQENTLEMLNILKGK